MAVKNPPKTEEPVHEDTEAPPPPEAVPVPEVEEKVVYDPDCASGRK